MKECVAAVGTFDGVHLGHVKILDTVKAVAEERGLASRVITFPNHPLSVVAPERAPGWILPREDSVSILEDNVDRVSELNFTKELASLTAAEFLKLIAERYNVKVLVMGHDNTFGSDRLSSRADYEAAAKEAGIEIVWVEAAKLDDGTIVSSSLVRKALAEGDMDKVVTLLNGMYMLAGTVKEGRKQGRRLNFPTLNLDHEGFAPLAPGVYMGVYVDYDGMGHAAVVNVGNNPTLGPDNPVTYEVHVINHDLGDRYGKRENVDLWERLRDEKKFDSLDELKAQIGEDVRLACMKLLAAADKMREIYDFHPDTTRCLIAHGKAHVKRLKDQARKLGSENPS